jgi:hypothetical protein
MRLAAISRLAARATHDAHSLNLYFAASTGDANDFHRRENIALFKSGCQKVESTDEKYFRESVEFRASRA